MISLDPAEPLSLCSLLDGPGRAPPWNTRVFPQRIPGRWRPAPSRERPGSLKDLGYHLHSATLRAHGTSAVTWKTKLSFNLKSTNTHTHMEKIKANFSTNSTS